MGVILIMVICDMKIVNPKIGKYIKNVKLDEGMVREDLFDVENTYQEIDFMIENIELNGCRFVNVDFSSFPLKNVDLIDCIFEKCNLSGSDFSNRGMHRVKFDKCNMVGCSLISSSIKDVSILESKANYINFSSGKIVNFEIKNSVVKEGSFVSSSLTNIIFDEVDFEGCEFLNTKLENIDFSNCNINEIGVSSNDIKGVIVNEQQALMLITLFGIIVKE